MMDSDKGLRGRAHCCKVVAGARGASECSWVGPNIPSLPQHLQEALGLPAGRGDENPEGTPEDEETWGTQEDGQGEEEEETTPTPSSGPSPSPTPEDTVTYIRE